MGVQQTLAWPLPSAGGGTIPVPLQAAERRAAPRHQSRTRLRRRPQHVRRRAVGPRQHPPRHVGRRLAVRRGQLAVRRQAQFQPQHVLQDRPTAPRSPGSAGGPARGARPRRPGRAGSPAASPRRRTGGSAPAGRGSSAGRAGPGESRWWSRKQRGEFHPQGRRRVRVEHLDASSLPSSGRSASRAGRGGTAR